MKLKAKTFLVKSTKNLFILYTLAHLKQKANVRGTIFGYLWWFIEPLMLIALYSYVVGVIFGHAGPDRILKIAIGVTLWKWWSTAMSSATTSFRRYKGIVTQVKMPISILPISDVCGQTYLFLFGYILLQVALLYFGFIPDVAALLITVISSIFVVSTLALLMAILNVFIRDTAFLVGFGLRILFYITPILYPRERVPEHYQWMVDYNPLAYLIEGYNNALVVTDAVDYQMMLLGMGISFVVLVMSLFLCRKITSDIIRNI
jgi:ABC-type polysaccharide/polyol phosphate export permease